MHEKHHYCIYPFDPHHNQKHPTYLFLRQEEEEDKGGGEEEESSSKRKKKTTVFYESCSITTPQKPSNSLLSKYFRLDSDSSQMEKENIYTSLIPYHSYILLIAMDLQRPHRLREVKTKMLTGILYLHNPFVYKLLRDDETKMLKGFANGMCIDQRNWSFSRSYWIICFEVWTIQICTQFQPLLIKHSNEEINLYNASVH